MWTYHETLILACCSGYVSKRQAAEQRSRGGEGQQSKACDQHRHFSTLLCICIEFRRARFSSNPYIPYSTSDLRALYGYEYLYCASTVRVKQVEYNTRS